MELHHLDGLSHFFDTMGTVVGLADEAGLLDEAGKLPGIDRVLLVDSVAAAAGGLAILIVERHVHRERGRHQRGRAHGTHVAGGRRAIPAGDLLLTDRGCDPRRRRPLLYVVAAVFAWYFFHGLLA